MKKQLATFASKTGRIRGDIRRTCCEIYVGHVMFYPTEKAFLLCRETDGNAVFSQKWKKLHDSLHCWCDIYIIKFLGNERFWL